MNILLKNKKEVQLDELMPVIIEKLEAGGEVHISSSGNSMYPLFRHRKDTVCLKKGSIKKYDMILYKRDDGKYVLHRIVGIKNNCYVLRGDHQLYNEYPIRDNQVIAKVISFCRNNKQVNCHNIWYQIYVFVWVHTMTLRKIVCYIKRI